MKAITLTQPWATLVAIGAKRVETRDWLTHYRGEIAIHAAKAFPKDARALVSTSPFADVLGTETLHTAQIIAVATLTRCWPFGVDTIGRIHDASKAGRLPLYEAYFGDYAPGRYGFVLENVRRLERPIYCRGSLGLWNIPQLTEHELREQLAKAAAA
jgi:hypothetical protein